MRLALEAAAPVLAAPVLPVWLADPYKCHVFHRKVIVRFRINTCDETPGGF